MTQLATQIQLSADGLETKQRVAQVFGSLKPMQQTLNKLVASVFLSEGHHNLLGSKPVNARALSHFQISEYFKYWTICHGPILMGWERLVVVAHAYPRQTSLHVYQFLNIFSRSRKKCDCLIKSEIMLLIYVNPSFIFSPAQMSQDGNIFSLLGHWHYVFLQEKHCLSCSTTTTEDDSKYLV